MIENYEVQSYEYEYNDDHYKNLKRKPKYKFKNFMLAILICLVAVSITYRFVRITRLNYEINKMENELQTLNGENQNLNVKLAETENLNTIERTAKSKLHMHEPTEENIVYVNVKNYNLAKMESDEIKNSNIDFDTFFIKIFGIIIR